MRRIAIPLCWLIVLVSTGCAGSSELEPRLIVLRNSTTHDLGEMLASQVRRQEGESVRMGSVAPLPAGREFVLDRPPDPPPLPSKAQIEWLDHAGERHEMIVPLRKTLKHSTGTFGEALVFDLQPNGTIKLYLDLVVR